MAQGATPGRASAVAATLWRSSPWVSSAVLVVVLLACVLVPLPTGLVDLLLSISLAGAILLLVAALGVGRASELLGFPAWLLLITLFRLALNLSTTRLILSQADAGEVVASFATFVVRNDLVVGAVMFLIITVVQYLVIARGAERVAEVAARFALDGLPGHQAAIDADLRAKVISAREATRRRAALADRSSFYGNMDGAVRFTKYDAIAGLTIMAVNLVGGLTIGMGRMGYSWYESLEVYGRLAIGDGLIAQIPALLVSLAAGVLVARVDRQQQAEQPAQWLQPAMLAVPAALLAVLAPVPGMPTLAFLVTAIGIGLVAIGVASQRSATRVGARGPSRRIAVRIPSSQVADEAGLRRALVQLRSRCAETLGIDVPPIELDVVPDLDHGLDVRFDDRVLMRIDRVEASEDAIVVAVFRAIMDRADELVDLQLLDEAVERERGIRPTIVRQALERVSLAELLAIVKAFLRERIPLPPLGALLTVVAETRAFADDSERAGWAKMARERLASYWVHDLLDGIARLGKPCWVRPEPQWEHDLLARSQVVDHDVVLDVAQDRRRAWADTMRASAIEGTDPTKARPIVLLTTARARRAVAALVEGATPHIAVLSTRELELARIDTPADARWLAPELP